MKFNLSVEYEYDEYEYDRLEERIEDAVVERTAQELMVNLSSSYKEFTIAESVKGVKRSVANQIAEILKDEIDTESIVKRLEKKIEKELEKNKIEEFSRKVLLNVEKELTKKIEEEAVRQIKKSFGKLMG